MICILVGHKCQSLPISSLEKSVPITAFPAREETAVWAQPQAPGDDFLIEGNQTLVRTPGSKEAPLFDFFPLPELPHRLENGSFYFNKAFGKMLANHKCGLQAQAPEKLITVYLRNI